MGYNFFPWGIIYKNLGIISKDIVNVKSKVTNGEPEQNFVAELFKHAVQKWAFGLKNSMNEVQIHLPPYLILSSCSVRILSSGLDKSPNCNKNHELISLIGNKS